MGLLLDGQELVSSERDALYQETARTQANGLLQTMKYDPAGRLIEQQLSAATPARKQARHGYPAPYRPDAQVGMQAAIQRRYRYDQSGQLATIEDSRRGRIEYRYDPVGRLLAANSALGNETFAFDPAGNIRESNTAQRPPISRGLALPKLLDNLLKEYAGVSYRYDDRGNLTERLQQCPARHIRMGRLQPHDACNHQRWYHHLCLRSAGTAHRQTRSGDSNAVRLGWRHAGAGKQYA